MATKEEIELRVEEAARAYLRKYCDISSFCASTEESMLRRHGECLRPLVERIVSLEDELASERAARGTAAMHAFPGIRTILGASVEETSADAAARIMAKLAAAEQRAIDLDRARGALDADRSRVLADLGEARAELRTMSREREDDWRTIEALRAQVAALTPAQDPAPAAELALVRAERDAAVAERARLETTVDVLAARLAGRS